MVGQLYGGSSVTSSASS